MRWTVAAAGLLALAITSEALRREFPPVRAVCLGSTVLLEGLRCPGGGGAPAP